MSSLATPFQGAPAATAILAAFVAVSLLALRAAPGLLERGVFRPYWVARRPEPWTPLTSAFLHADFAHLLFNGITFWAFAFSLERRIGSASFVLLYAVGIAVSQAGTWVRHRHEPGYGTLGASGAILAVLFAAILYQPTQKLYFLPLPVPIPAPLFALGYLGYSLYASRRGTGRVNHDAHLSGALAGIAYVALTDASTLARAWRVFFG